MTIFATHFNLVLGAWRLRVRIDLDEPRDADLEERASASEPHRESEPAARRDLPTFIPRGSG
jgi:hypothetical protein